MRGYELTDRGKIVIAGLVVLLLLVLSVVLMVKAIANQTLPAPDNHDSASYVTPSPKPTGIYPEITDSPPPNGGDFTQQDTTPSNGGDSTQQGVTTPSNGGDSTQQGATTPSNGGDSTQQGATTPSNGGDSTQQGATTPSNGGDSTQQGATTPSNGGDSTQQGATTPNSNADNPPSTSLPTASDNPGALDLPDGQNNSQNSGNGVASSTLSGGTLSFLFSPDNQKELDTDTIFKLEELLKSPDNSRNSTIAVETVELSNSSKDTLMSAVTIALADFGVPEERIAYVLRRSGVAGEIFEVKLYFIPASEK